MENGAIRDWDIKFTSEAAKDFARFITAQYGWEINNGAKPAFVQVHLGPARKIITAVATQLGRNNQYLISYSISYSDDGIDWVMYRENGEVKVRKLKSNNRLQLMPYLSQVCLQNLLKFKTANPF